MNYNNPNIGNSKMTRSQWTANSFNRNMFKRGFVQNEVTIHCMRSELIRSYSLIVKVKIAWKPFSSFKFTIVSTTWAEVIITEMQSILRWSISYIILGDGKPSYDSSKREVENKEHFFTSFSIRFLVFLEKIKSNRIKQNILACVSNVPVRYVTQWNDTS